MWVGFLFSRNAASVVFLFENFRKRSVLVVLFAIFSTGSRAFFLSGSRGTSIGSIEKKRFGETPEVFFLDRAGPFSNLPSRGRAAESGAKQLCLSAYTRRIREASYPCVWLAAEVAPASVFAAGSKFASVEMDFRK